MILTPGESEVANLLVTRLELEGRGVFVAQNACMLKSMENWRTASGDHGISVLVHFCLLCLSSVTQFPKK